MKVMLAVAVLLLSWGAGNRAAGDDPPAGRRDAFGDPLPNGAFARVGTIRLRHGAGVRGVAFSRDGKLLASAGGDQTVRVWQTATGKEVYVFQQFTNWVEAIEFSPDGKTLVSAGWDGLLRIHDLATGNEAGRLGVREGNWTSIRLWPDGKKATTGDWNNGVRLWDLDRGEWRHVLQPPDFVRPPGRPVPISANGALAVSVTAKNAIRIWDVESGKQVMELPRQQNTPYQAVFSPDDRYLAAHGNPRGISLWELATGKLVYVLPTEGAELFAFSPDGRTFVTAGELQLRWWDLAAGKERRRQKFQGAAKALAFSHDGRTLAVGTLGGTVRLLDAASGKDLRLSLVGHDGGTRPLAFSADGKSLMVASAGAVLRWDLEEEATAARGATARLGRSLDVAGEARVVSSGGAFLAVSCRNGETHVWDYEAAKDLGKLDHFKFLSVAFAPTGATVATAGDGQVLLREVGKPEVVRRIVIDKARDIGIGFTPDGKTLASVDEESLRFWDLATGKEKRRLRLLDAPRRSSRPSVVFSPDGRTLALADASRQLQLWDVPAGRYLVTLPAGAEIAFSPNSRLLAVMDGKDRKAIAVWDLVAQKQVKKLQGHRGAIKGLLFSADGKTLASGSADNTVLLWRVGP